MRNHTKIGLKERELIQRWKADGLSNAECARRLGRPKCTIGRELRRNQSPSGVYVAVSAQVKADQRKNKAWKAKYPLKNAKVFKYTIKQLMRGWSPEQIAGRLREVEHPDDKSWHICHETIYQYIYHPSKKHRKLWEYLRRGQKKRRKRGCRKVHRSRIPDRVSIHKRPTKVDERMEFGHWEGDSIVGKGKRNGLHTSYERVSSVTKMGYMEEMTALESARAQKEIYREMPEGACRTVTLDNGSEHALHKQVEKTVGIQTYFADPYSSWQRGGNENANLWIRYYFPKGTDFSKMSREEIADVEWELNNRPRKRLGFLFPQEVFDRHLRKGLHS